jgi:hypothetical protein
MTTVMNGPAYPRGRLAAQKAHEYFSRYRDQIPDTSRERIASVPSADVIEAVIDAAFWASLRRQEGYVPRLSLAILDPEQARQPLWFANGFPPTPDNLAKVSPAGVRPGLHIAVSRCRDELCVWGTVRSLPMGCCVIEIAAPGLLVIKQYVRKQSTKFVNIAVLEGEQMKLVRHNASVSADCSPLVSSLLGLVSRPLFESTDVLLELAVSMRAHQRGGALLVVPNDGDLWRESIVHPIPYGVIPRFAELGELIHERHTRLGGRLETEFGDAVDMIAGLTAVDGATMITDQYELIAFGAKIARRDDHARVEQVRLTEPIDGTAPTVVHPTQLGGTRHLSAMQFVHDQRNALALVASQDGRFTVFSWASCDGMVHAHRVEALLL